MGHTQKLCWFKLTNKAIKMQRALRKASSMKIEKCQAGTVRSCSKTQMENLKVSNFDFSISNRLEGSLPLSPAYDTGLDVENF